MVSGASDHPAQAIGEAFQTVAVVDVEHGRSRGELAKGRWRRLGPDASHRNGADYADGRAAFTFAPHATPPPVAATAVDCADANDKPMARRQRKSTGPGGDFRPIGTRRAQVRRRLGAAPLVLDDQDRRPAVRYPAR